MIIDDVLQQQEKAFSSEQSSTSAPGHSSPATSGKEARMLRRLTSPLHKTKDKDGKDKDNKDKEANDKENTDKEDQVIYFIILLCYIRALY